MSKIPTRGPLDDSVKLGIPSVTTDPESLRRATIALTRAMEELARQRGDVGRSAVRVNDLVKLGLVSPDIIHTLDPGGAKYLQRGPAGFALGASTPTTPPVLPDQPPPSNPSYSWNDLIDLPDCFYPCEHTHPWDDIIGKPETFPPEPHTHDWTDIPDHPHDGLVLVDCCGLIVRDCTQITEGGNWEYSNPQLTVEHVKTTTGSIQQGIDIVGPNFESLSADRISWFFAPGFLQTKTTPDQEFRQEVWRDDLTVVEETILVNGNGPFSSGVSSPNLSWYPTAINYATQQFTGAHPQGIPTVWAPDGAGNFHWLNHWKPEPAAATYWNATGWMGDEGPKVGEIWMRETGIFVLENANSQGYDYELHKYNPILSEANWTGGNDTYTVGDSDNPEIAVARIQLSDPAVHFIHVNATGSRVYLLSSETASQPYLLTVYDSDLNVIETQDVAFIYPGSITPQIRAFAVQGPYIFVAFSTGLFTMHDLETGSLQASTTATVPIGYTLQVPAKIVPHPDGTLYLQHYEGIGSTNRNTRFHTIKYADATFVPQVTSEWRFDCREIAVAGGTSTPDPFEWTIQAATRISTPARFFPELEASATNPGERRRGKREISDRVIKDFGIVSDNFGSPAIYDLGGGNYNNRLFWRTIDADTGAILSSGDFYAPTIANRNNTSDSADCIRGASNHWIYGANISPSGAIHLRAGAAASPTLQNADGDTNWTWTKPASSLYTAGRGAYLLWRNQANTFTAPSFLCFYPCPGEDSLPASGIPSKHVEIEFGEAYTFPCGQDAVGNLYIAVGSTRANRLMRVYEPDGLTIIREFPLSSLYMGGFDSSPPDAYIFGGLGNAQYFVHRGTAGWGIYTVPTDASDPVLVENFNSVDPKEATYPDRPSVISGQYLYANVYDEIWELTTRSGTGSPIIDPCRLTITNGDAQAGNPTLDLCEVVQGLGGELRARTVDQWGRVIENRAVVSDDIPELPISKITGLQTELDSKLTVEDAAVYEFLVADNIPYKQFIYDTGLLVTINLYDDAGLTNLRYSKQLVRTGDFLTSIVLTRHPDLAQWTKTLTYNLDDALETVATAAA